MPKSASPFRDAVNRLHKAGDAREAGMARVEADRVASRAVALLLAGPSAVTDKQPEPPKPKKPAPKPTLKARVSKVMERSPVDGMKVSPDGTHICDGLCRGGECR